MKQNCIYVLLFLTFVTAVVEAGFKNQKLVVLSLDGFRQTFLNDNFLPWFKLFRNRGPFASTIKPVFPSSTQPNHYTIATGLYPTDHGIVANQFYDPTLKETFSASTSSDYKWWSGAEPLWITAKKQGLKTATSFWPGDDVNFGGTTPDYRSVYGEKVATFQQRWDEVTDWLNKKQVDVVFMRYYEPYATGATKGSSSPETGDMIGKLDWYLSYMLMTIEDRALASTLNLIICSGNGIYDWTNKLALQDYLDFGTDIDQVPSYGPVTHIIPKDGQTDSVVTKLKNVNSPNFSVYKRAEIPEKYNYRDNERIAPIVVISTLGTIVTPLRSTVLSDVAMDGWDPTYEAMQPVFMGAGPAFRQSSAYDISAKYQMATTDIYEIACSIIGVEPRANNGSTAIRDAIVKRSAGTKLAPTNVLYLGLVVFMGLLAKFH